MQSPDRTKNKSNCRLRRQMLSVLGCFVTPDNCKKESPSDLCYFYVPTTMQDQRCLGLNSLRSACHKWHFFRIQQRKKQRMMLAGLSNLKFESRFCLRCKPASVLDYGRYNYIGLRPPKVFGLRPMPVTKSPAETLALLARNSPRSSCLGVAAGGWAGARKFLLRC